MDKMKLNFEVYNQSVDLPEVKEIRDGRRDYVYWGEDNLFPQYLYELYSHSALFESIIRGTKNYVTGNDIIIAEGVKLNQIVNKDLDTLQDIIEKVIFDYLLYDGFAIQVFKDGSGNITELYNIDLQNIRIGKDDETVYYSPDWKKQNAKYTAYPMYKVGKNQKNSIFFYKGKTALQTNTYPVPSYIGALSDIRTSVEISNFHLSSVINGFNGNLVINLNSGEVDDETKKRIEKKFQEKFCGSSNAGKFVLNFNENKDTAITLERLQSDDYADRYNALEKSITNNIFVAFRTLPQLFGLRSEGNMFNHDEYLEAAALYQKTVITPIQRIIERAFSHIFGIDEAIKIVPFKLDENDKNITEQ